MNQLKYLPKENLKEVLSSEEEDKIAQALEKRYKTFLNDEVFKLETGFSLHQVQMKLTLKKKDESIEYPLEGIFLKEENAVEKSNSEIILLMIDYLDVYWSEYFSEARSVFFPIDWSGHSCEGLTFYFRGFIRNKSLEAQADEILKKNGFGNYDISSISSIT